MNLLLQTVTYTREYPGFWDVFPVLLAVLAVVLIAEGIALLLLAIFFKVIDR